MIYRHTIAAMSERTISKLVVLNNIFLKLLRANLDSGQSLFKLVIVLPCSKTEANVKYFEDNSFFKHTLGVRCAVQSLKSTSCSKVKRKEKSEWTSNNLCNLKAFTSNPVRVKTFQLDYRVSALISFRSKSISKLIILPFHTGRDLQRTG